MGRLLRCYEVQRPRGAADYPGLCFQHHYALFKTKAQPCLIVALHRCPFLQASVLHMQYLVIGGCRERDAPIGIILVSVDLLVLR